MAYQSVCIFLVSVLEVTLGIDFLLILQFLNILALCKYERTSTMKNYPLIIMYAYCGGQPLYSDLFEQNYENQGMLALPSKL